MGGVTTSDSSSSRLLELYEKIKGGVVNTPWDKLIPIHAEMYEILYGMKFDGELFLNDVSHMMQRFPLIGVQFDQIAKMQGDLRPEDLQELPRIMTQFNYVQAGKKDFYVYSDLVPMLRDTDLPDMHASELKFPFEAFSIVFKQGAIRGRGTNVDRIFVTCPDGLHVTGFLCSDNHNGAPIFISNLSGPFSLKDMVHKSAEFDTDTGVPSATPAQDLSLIHI